MVISSILSSTFSIYLRETVIEEIAYDKLNRHS